MTVFRLCFSGKTIDRMLKSLGPHTHMTTVRLAIASGSACEAASLGPHTHMTTVRLAVSGHSGGADSSRTLTALGSTPMTDVRLALGGPPEACVKGLSVRPGPSILVSYFYIEQAFNRYRERLVFRDWVMDSGAYSAHNSGGQVSLDEYIEECKKREDDPQLTEVFALDVIGDYKASLVNTERMWKEGVKAVPCYHVGEPWDVLTSLARDYPKIALGGAVGLRSKVKMAWAQECFARVWPKKIHGFGFGGEKMILSYPFHSVDATNWELGPTKFGNWKRFGNMSVRGGQASGGHNLRCEVEWYMKLEQHAKQKWAKEMALLETL